MSFATFCRPSVQLAEVSPVLADDAPEVEFAEWNPPVETSRQSATMTAPRKSFLDRLRTAAKGDAARLSINGACDLSILFGSRECAATMATDDTPATPAAWTIPDYRLDLRDSWERSGELHAVIPTKRLQQILAKAKGDDVVKVDLFADAETADAGVIVRTGKAEFTLATDAAEFPEEFPVGTEHSMTCAAADLLRALEQTVYATDCDSTRYALGGVLVEFRGDKLYCAATDSRRLAVIDIPAAGVDGVQFVIPAAAMELAVKQLKGDAGQVRVAVDAANDGMFWEIAATDWTLSGRCVQGRFPDWRKVVPSHFSGILKIDRADLLESLDTAMCATDEASRGVDFAIAADQLTLSSKDSTGGSARVSVPSEWASTDGLPETITFDPRYIVDYLKANSGADVVCLAIIDHESAAVMECEGGAQYVIMPLSRDR